MDFNKYTESFEKELYDACLKDLEVLKLNESNDLIFSYAIYLPSGFETFSSASCNHKGITEALAEMSNIKDSANQIIKILERTLLGHQILQDNTVTQDRAYLELD